MLLRFAYCCGLFQFAVVYALPNLNKIRALETVEV